MARKSPGLYTDIARSLKTEYLTLDGQLKAGLPVYAGGAGTVKVSRNSNGAEFYIRRYTDGGGNSKDEYLGMVGDATAEARAEAVREAINEVKGAIERVRLLNREGFQLADGPTYATLASLHLNKVFEAGACLVGSHAYGALLNQLGVRAEAYATEDVDVARREALAFETIPDKTFIEMLRESGIDFIEVPRINVREPSTSFKERGKSHFHVDLLVPATGREIGFAPVPELGAHASTMPYLAYLLGERQQVALLSLKGVCPVSVPVPERFAIHKLIASQLRVPRDDKVKKDQHQAAVLIAVLSEQYPGAVTTAIQAAPNSSIGLLKRAVAQIDSLLKNHPAAHDELQTAIGDYEAATEG